MLLFVQRLVLNVVSVKKRKLLHGRSACDELAVLKSINEPLAKNLEGYLCVICQRKLLRVREITPRVTITCKGN